MTKSLKKIAFLCVYAIDCITNLYLFWVKSVQHIKKYSIFAP